MINTRRPRWVQVLFKIRIGKYRWGSLQADIYTSLNHRYQAHQLPQEIHNRASAHIRREPVKKISVIIATRNRPDVLNHCAIDSLMCSKVNTVGFEVIIVDNSSDDVTEKRCAPLCKEDSRFRYVRQKKKKSAAVSRNRGVAVATGDVIAFIDDDCRVDQDWLERMAQWYRRGPYVAGLGYIFDTLLQRQLVKEQPQYFECKFFSGNLSFRRDIFALVQFNEAMEVYGEDRDLVYRLSMLWPDFPYFVDRVPIEHVRAASEYRSDGSPELNRVGTRLDTLMDQLWWINRFMVRRNANPNQFLFSIMYWVREIYFLPLEFFLVRGRVKFLLHDKYYIYTWLKHLRNLKHVQGNS